jgi:hypothetical protein
MKAHNIPVTYVLFPDEGHGFARPANNIAFNAVTENFLPDLPRRPRRADRRGGGEEHGAGAGRRRKREGAGGKIAAGRLAGPRRYARLARTA